MSGLRVCRWVAMALASLEDLRLYLESQQLAVRFRAHLRRWRWHCGVSCCRSACPRAWVPFGSPGRSAGRRGGCCRPRHSYGCPAGSYASCRVPCRLAFSLGNRPGRKHLVSEFGRCVSRGPDVPQPLQWGKSSRAGRGVQLLSTGHGYPNPSLCISLPCNGCRSRRWTE